MYLLLKPIWKIHLQRQKINKKSLQISFHILYFKIHIFSNDYVNSMKQTTERTSTVQNRQQNVNALWRNKTAYMHTCTSLNIIYYIKFSTLWGAQDLSYPFNILILLNDVSIFACNKIDHISGKDQSIFVEPFNRRD